MSAFGLVGMSAIIASVATSGGDVLSANGQSSAIAKAVAINAITSSSGVTATAMANTVTGGGAVATGTISSGDIYINGTNIGAVSVENNDSTGALISAINDITTSTGVTAETNADNKLVLTAADGRNVTITGADSAAIGYLNLLAGDFVNNTSVYRSTVQLNDDEEIQLTGTLADLYDAGTSAANNLVKTTDTTQSIATSSASYNIASISIATQVSAEAAILTVDAALDDVSSIRAQIGAVQNRLEFTVSNLGIAAENMSAAKSRIMDADFAQETAIFTRNQIMVQAATAILAQANTMPQLALQLLG
jgi:flagellin